MIRELISKNVKKQSFFISFYKLILFISSANCLYLYLHHQEAFHLSEIYLLMP